MDRNVRIAKELLRIAKNLVAVDEENEFHFDKLKNEIRITLTKEELNNFLKSSEYQSMKDWFMNAEGGKRDFTSKGGMMTAEFALYPNNEETKSHSGEIINMLSGLGYKKA